MYWDNFYKNFKELEPSPFVKSLNLSDKRIVDLGCGNGRDTYYMAKNNTVIGIDEAVLNENRHSAVFKKCKITDFKRECDVLYARFLLHAVDEETEDYILDWAKDCEMLCLEARAIGDEPKLYKDHPRRLIDPAKLLNKIIKLGFHVKLEYGRGLAKYKDEDPLIIRMICTR